MQEENKNTTDPQFHKTAVSKSVLEWVRCTEELPKMETVIILKDNIGLYRIGNFYNADNKIWLYISGINGYEEYIINENMLQDYFWLKDFNNHE